MLRAAWDAHAHEWIAWARTPGHDSYDRWHRDLFLPLVPPPGRLTLDLGCGEGRVARDLTALGHRVVGLDGSPTMVAAALAHPQRGGPAVVADAAAMPLCSRSADCAVSFMSLQDVDAWEVAVAEAARVLRPGGTLVVAMTQPLNTAGRFLPAEVDAARPFVIEGSWYERQRFDDFVERDGLTMTFSYEHRPLQDYVDALADSGFVIERIREVGEPDPDDKWHRVPLFLHLRARREPPR